MSEEDSVAVGRSWTIAEQCVEDPSTKLRLEFSSVWSDEVNAGNEAPDRDDIVILRLWTSQRDRLATFRFERSGRFIRTDIEPLAEPEPEPATVTAPLARAGLDEDHHWTHPLLRADRPE